MFHVTEFQGKASQMIITKSTKKKLELEAWVQNESSKP